MFKSRVPHIEAFIDRAEAGADRKGLLNPNEAAPMRSAALRDSIIPKKSSGESPTNAPTGSTILQDAAPAANIENETPLTVKEAAKFLGVSPQTVYLWAERKQIPISA